MLKKFVVAVAVGIFAAALVLPTGYADAFSEPIPIKISLLKWGGNPRVGKLFKMVSKAANPPLFTLPDPVGSDPVTTGGSLLVVVGAGGVGGTLQCTLAAGAFNGTVGWKALGNPAGSKGYKYINKNAPTPDPCKIAIIKETVIKVLANSVGGINLPAAFPPGNPDVRVSIAAGADEYCAAALAPHFKEKEDTLIKMKSQAAPASCVRCGDDAVNQVSEECDGTDDSACPGSCVPPGGGGGTCGDDVRNGGDECTCGVEECDGTDAALCQGICLPNCTCPEPICNNGVKEAGEVCDPAGSTADCPPGEICGGFCTCVSDEACNCGSPDPTLYKFTTKPPAEPTCGSTDGDPPLDGLDCMAFYMGGGEGALPVPVGMPDEATIKLNVAQCKGTDLTLEHTTPEEAGRFNCTEGKKCSAVSDNPGEPCLRDVECPNGTCEAGCLYLAPMALFDRNLPTLSSCITNEIAEDALGGVNCTTGETFVRLALDSTPHLTLGDQSPTTPGHQPCPLCLGGTLGVQDSGTCEGGPNNGLACTPQSTPYDAADCCAGGVNNTKFCLDDSDCPGSTCVSGCTGYPTSHDCPPNPLAEVATLFWVGGLQPGAETKTADGDGNFCGWCRDIEVEGSSCFEGNPDAGPPSGGKGCPDSSLIACRPATYHGPGGGDPADIAECGDGLTCRTDADCQAPYESCEQRVPGAFRNSTIRSITVTGKLPDPPDLSDKLPHRGVVGTHFCIPPIFDPILDASGSFPGPATISFDGDHQLSPSGAFMETTNGLLD